VVTLPPTPKLGSRSPGAACAGNPAVASAATTTATNTTRAPQRRTAAGLPTAAVPLPESSTLLMREYTNGHLAPPRTAGLSALPECRLLRTLDATSRQTSNEPQARGANLWPPACYLTLTRSPDAAKGPT
jgi:hypothetical protein